MNTTTIDISAWVKRLRDFMTRSLEHPPSEASEGIFNDLALECFAWQITRNPVLKRFVDRLDLNLSTLSHWTQIPSLPVVAFKEFPVSCIPQEQRTSEFHSSGTSGDNPSRHYHHAESLALYELSLLDWFQQHLAPNEPLPRPIFLTPPLHQAPRSSLVHMFETIHRHTRSSHALFAGKVNPSSKAWELNTSRVTNLFELSVRTSESLTILGTAFNFVQLLDELAVQNLSYQLPPGTRVMETGGYKGRTREIPKYKLHAWISELLGVPAENILCEYGMSELSSQAYDAVVGGAEEAPRTFQFPPWARARIVSPENGQEVAVGETGMIQIYDLANAWSVMALQTEDLGTRHKTGFSLVGRATHADPKGCSLQALAS